MSLDGFTMASALPEGMQEDRVGAMSAAILGLGERAAAELGRGQLSQVFIEGDDGYVMLIAAGDRAVLTCLAGKRGQARLVLYDMRDGRRRDRRDSRLVGGLAIDTRTGTERALRWHCAATSRTSACPTSSSW